MSSQSRVALERAVMAWSGLGRTCGGQRPLGLLARGGVGQGTREHHVLTYIGTQSESRAPLWFVRSGGHMQTQARTHSTSGPYDFTKKSYSTKGTNGVENSELDPHAEEQEREHEFTPMRDRDMLERLDSQAHHMSLDEISASCMQASEEPSAGVGAEGEHHNSTGGVSLSGVMQSNVPEPFQSTTRGSPTHMNMPGGGSRRQDKYLAGHIKDVHPSRQYSTTTRVIAAHDSADSDNLYTPYSDMQGLQGDIGVSVQDMLHLENPCPQGVQGEDCEHFKQWLNNCVRYGHAGCEENLTAFHAGRKTLPEIFAEQEKLIAQAAVRRHHPQQNLSGSVRHFSSSPQPKGGVPGSEGVGETIEGAGAEVILSPKDKLKRAVKEYGGTVIVFHVTISLMSLGTAYLAVSSGLDVVGILQKMGVGQAIIESRLATGTGTFVVAYAVHKVFMPVRIGTTLTCTPFIVRYLRRIGFLKPPKV